MYMNQKWHLPRLHIGLERWRYNIRIDAWISTYGNIRNRKWLPQKVCANNGYLFYRGVAVHRLVMETFCPVPGWNGLTVDHRNHNTRDNRLSNLEWVTRHENEERAKKDSKENDPAQDASKDADVKMVLLNGIKLPYDDALKIMVRNAGLKGVKGNVESSFRQSELTGKPVSYGGNIIQVLA